jgi:hypothetical protein
LVTLLTTRAYLPDLRAENAARLRVQCRADRRDLRCKSIACWRWVWRRLMVMVVAQ